jgi:hypothetical protein
VGNKQRIVAEIPHDMSCRKDQSGIARSDANTCANNLGAPTLV